MDEGITIVNVVNATAGLFSGDRLSAHVSVEPGARLLLTFPSSSRVHCATAGLANVVQEFHVANSGFLDIWPELFIPQNGARYRQRTSLHVGESGELLYFEAVAPGRVASGEVFAFDSLAWSTDAFVENDPILRERFRLAPNDESTAVLRTKFATPYYAGCIAVSPRLRNRADGLSELNALYDAGAWIGCTRIHRHGWAIRILAESSIALRRKIGQLRTALYSALDRKLPNLRRASPIA